MPLANKPLSDIILPFLSKERYRSGHNGADSKSDGGRLPPRGFESHPLRHIKALKNRIASEIPVKMQIFNKIIVRSSVVTSFFSYSAVGEHRQGEIIQGLRQKNQPPLSVLMILLKR